jgi:tRNA threonylcarbamoyladenosine biosynthesis protein TsaE
MLKQHPACRKGAMAMNDGSTYRVIARDAEQTQRLGQLIGQWVQSGLVIRLLGDLGAGKTCFVQGLAKGLAVPDAFAVTSPTYTLINEFPGRLPLFHVDLYRLHSGEDAEAIGFYDILTGDHVVAVEWADRLADLDWPSETLVIRFQTQPDESRQIHLIGSGLQIANLIQKIGSLWGTEADESFAEKK